MYMYRYVCVVLQVLPLSFEELEPRLGCCCCCCCLRCCHLSILSRDTSLATKLSRKAGLSRRKSATASAAIPATSNTLCKSALYWTRLLIWETSWFAKRGVTSSSVCYSCGGARSAWRGSSHPPAAPLAPRTRPPRSLEHHLASERGTSEALASNP